VFCARPARTLLTEQYRAATTATLCVPVASLTSRSVGRLAAVRSRAQRADGKRTGQAPSGSRDNGTAGSTPLSKTRNDSIGQPVTDAVEPFDVTARELNASLHRRPATLGFDEPALARYAWSVVRLISWTDDITRGYRVARFGDDAAGFGRLAPGTSSADMQPH